METGVHDDCKLDAVLSLSLSLSLSWEDAEDVPTLAPLNIYG